MLSRVSDEAIQICGGMGLMADIPLERIWRDARIERYGKERVRYKDILYPALY